MNVLLEERAAKRLRNRGEVLNDDIDVVEGSPPAQPSVLPKASVDGQAAGQRAPDAVTKKGVHGFRSPARIAVCQDAREHVQ